MRGIRNWFGSMRSSRSNCCRRWEAWCIRPMRRRVRGRVLRLKDCTVLPGSDFWGGTMALQEGLFVDSDEFVVDGALMSDSVVRLTYLIHSVNDTGLVGLYAKQLEDRLRDVGCLLRSGDTDMRARLCN